MSPPSQRISAKQRKKEAAKLAKKKEDEKAIDDYWSEGSKDNTKKNSQVAKKNSKLLKKQEAAKLLEEENHKLKKKPTEYRASTIDDALMFFDSASAIDINGSSTSLNSGKKSRAAFLLYSNREQERLKKEMESLNYTKRCEHIRKSWAKSPENPKNQSNLTAEEQLNTLRIN